MKKFNSSKNIIIALIIVIVVVFLVSISAMQRDKKQASLPGQSQTNGVIAVVDDIVMAPIRGVENSVKSVFNLFNTYSENQHLKKRVDQNVMLQAELDNYKKENNQLKDQLKLNSTLSNYDIVNANVVNRSPDTWQDVLVINKGTKDGVETNMAVMGDKGLVGRVIISDKNSAKVELLTTVNKNTNHFPVMMETADGKESFGLMDAYNSKTHTLTVSQLTTVDGIKKGSKVVTSGLGNNSPKGLLIGEVQEIQKSKTGLHDEVLVTPISDMYDITTVTVIKRLEGSK
ncbi:rod shape-determining protein MreC [Vagococcus vulneris]|uniref:Cell shape-determining protein MreC n=1 Tax=Vagococcus vulneris TaxID=1977869 RepID=A0A429ZY56_9ENTE|nr:rod shape-determining protein MreC [Vagococcus vulneris]RST98884.1 rod shape-determining protein MreC [Vagococcus vulneris]